MGRFCWGLSLALLLCSAAPASAQLNTPPPGYTALFNGKDLTNWQGLIDIKRRATLSPEQRRTEQVKADEQMRGHWSIQDGILIYDGKGTSLQTIKDYGNFEMYVDWKILPKGDSGIYVRGNPQVQIWEDPVGSGGLYNNKDHPSKPLVVADNPAGQWNTFFIRMVADRVTVKLNGVLVVDNVPLENYWEKGKPLPARGPIELQHHGNTLQFRRIYLRELPDDAAAVPADRITLTVSQAPLSQVIQLLAANGNVEIVLQDPAGRLERRVMAFVSIKEKPVATAIEVVCRAAGLRWTRNPSGVYFLSEAP